MSVGVQSNDVAEQANLRSVRILEPITDQAFKTPLDAIPVKFEVDSPLGAFQNPDDVLTWRRCQSRFAILQGPSVKLGVDRQVHVVVDSTVSRRIACAQFAG